MNRNRQLLLVPILLMTALAEARDENTDAPPSLELLEYLAMLAEDENGHLVDPLEAMDDRVAGEHEARGPMNEWVNR